MSITSPTEFPGLFESRRRCRFKSSNSTTSTDGAYGQDDDDQLEEAREYMKLCDHNLHSVLINPRVSVVYIISYFFHYMNDVTAVNME